jgi:hypothetical protein
MMTCVTDIIKLTFSLLNQYCNQYDEYLEQHPHSNLPPSPTFKDVYQLTSNLKISEHKHINTYFNTYHVNNSHIVNLPFRGHLYFIKDMKSAIIDELIKNNVILASEEANAMEKGTIQLGADALSTAIGPKTAMDYAILRFVYKPI